MDGRFLGRVYVVALLLALVTCVFLFVLVFGDGPALEFLLVDGLDESEAEVEFSFACTSRSGDEEIHIGIDGLAEVDGVHREQR